MNPEFIQYVKKIEALRCEMAEKFATECQIKVWSSMGTVCLGHLTTDSTRVLIYDVDKEYRQLEGLYADMSKVHSKLDDLKLDSRWNNGTWKIEYDENKSTLVAQCKDCGSWYGPLAQIKRCKTINCKQSLPATDWSDIVCKENGDVVQVFNTIGKWKHA